MRLVLAWVITIVWVAMYVRKLLDPSFPVPAELTPVMLLAAGYLFGSDLRTKLSGKVADAARRADGVLREEEVEQTVETRKP